MSFLLRGADRLAAEVNKLIRVGVLSPRSPAADALLDYAAIRHGDTNPIGGVERVDRSISAPRLHLHALLDHIMLRDRRRTEQRRLWEQLIRQTTTLVTLGTTLTLLHEDYRMSRQDLEQTIADLKQAIDSDQAADQAVVDALEAQIDALNAKIAELGKEPDFADIIAELNTIKDSIKPVTSTATPEPTPGEPGETPINGAPE